jgi:hypothetical protein
MTALREVISEAYDHLHEHNLVGNQYQFSRDWLKKSKSYFGYLKSSQSETTTHVVLNLWAECRRQRMNWQNAANDNVKCASSKAVFENLAQQSEQVERYVSEAVLGRYMR